MSSTSGEDGSAWPEALVDLGWDSEWAEALDSAVASDTQALIDADPEGTEREPEPLVPARVVRVSNIRAQVSVGAAPMPATMDPPHPRPQLDEPPATGDWVAMHTADDGQRSVVAILPRRATISRRDPAELDARQVLAANIDVVLAVHGLDRPFNSRRLERLLVLAFDSGAQPMVVLTKTDLVDNNELAAVRSEAEVVAQKVPVLAISSTRGDGIEMIRDALGRGRTGVLLGESGAGKSTMVNALVGSSVQETGAVRDIDSAGRHTTTTRDLIRIPSGGLILDTPGLRALGLWDAAEGMALAFPEIVALGNDCRFRDCRHGAEPACAVTDAVANGEIDEERYRSWLGMRAELEELEQRIEERAWRQPEASAKPKRRGKRRRR